MERIFLMTGALSAFLAVALGAFAAHGLKTRLSPEMLAVFEVGVRYQMYHSLGLFVVAFMLSRWPQGAAAMAGWLFVAGIVVFSGSLYLLSTTGARWLGMITPLGGVAFLAGWLLLAWSAWRQ
ncbi:MAG TPA: DUF423 domain-containing protein [candidate division Zixibacteria bacterium]|nr:DUF423 domain-containing protein [candidate division Zixibacteria bacterium]